MANVEMVILNNIYGSIFRRRLLFELFIYSVLVLQISRENLIVNLERFFIRDNLIKIQKLGKSVFIFKTFNSVLN